MFIFIILLYASIKFPKKFDGDFNNRFFYFQNVDTFLKFIAEFELVNKIKVLKQKACPFGFKLIIFGCVKTKLNTLKSVKFERVDKPFSSRYEIRKCTRSKVKNVQ